MKSSEQLAALLRRGQKRLESDPEEPEPGSPEYAAVTRERADQAVIAIARIEARQTAIFLGLVAALIGELYRIAVHP